MLLTYILQISFIVKILGSFQSLVSGTKIFDINDASNYMLLQKKNMNDNLSKELEESKYTLEDVPSFQMCKESNLIIHTKGMHVLYFAKKNYCDRVHESDIIDEKDHFKEEEKKEQEEYYRYCIRGRENFYNIQSYRNCVGCLGLFIPAVSGVTLGCGHFLCDSCICRFRGNLDVGDGPYDYICDERMENGTKCLEASNLAFMDPSESLLHFRDSCFPAKQPDYQYPSNFTDNEIIPFNQRNPVENIIIMDSSVDTPVMNSMNSNSRTVSFRARDSFVQVSFQRFLQFIFPSYLI